MCDITLRITADTTGYAKVGWSVAGYDDPIDVAYQVDRSNLVTASGEVRKCLRRLVRLPKIKKDDGFQIPVAYPETLSDLVQRGGELFDSLFDINDNQSREIKEIVGSLGHNAGADGSDRQFSMSIIVDAGAPHVPWNFVCSPDAGPPQRPAFSISDFEFFWLSRFKVTVRYPGGRLQLPVDRQKSHECVQAVHETLLERSREEIRRIDASADTKISTLLSSGFCDSKWSRIREHFKVIGEDVDSIIYVFGHSNGSALLLDDSPARDSELPVSSFESTFRKRNDTRSASVCIFNGCRSAAPDDDAGDEEGIPEDRWPSGFRKATRNPGFYGFIGAETEVLNVWACLYGSQLLSLMSIDGLSLDEAFEALKRDKTTFPTNLAYTCCAQRNFRVPKRASAPTLN